MDASSAAQPSEPRHKRVIRKTLAALGVALLLAAPAFFLVLLQRSTNSQLLRVGDSIPAAALGGLDSGGAFVSGFSGKRTAILFFSVDCPRCQNEIPVFNEAERRFGSKVEFVAISLSAKKQTEAFVKAYDVRTIVLIDEKGIMGKRFGISELPAMFLVNQDQKVAWVGVGEHSRTALFRQLSALTDNNASAGVDGAQRNAR